MCKGSSHKTRLSVNELFCLRKATVFSTSSEAKQPSENKEFLPVPPSRSVVAEECTRPGQRELRLHRGDQGVLPHSPKLNWYDDIPLQVFRKQHEVYAVVNWELKIFPD